MDEKELQGKIEADVHKKLLPFFRKYKKDFSDLESVLKWKPSVLLIGNYSSGKSTLINELAGEEVQRTGQAPTDDSFTIITSEGEDEAGEEIPGSSLVNDDSLPFTSFRKHGEQFISHFRMKKVSAPHLKDMAIIDSPGMLDAVTEKDRGYDYMEVVSHLTKLADLIVLMFDPHKAGTIKETYTAIRDTLPENAGEDRIVFVMNRIDECDSGADLVRSFGTLCWNLSQMTGRKDIPHIYLTYAPGLGNSNLDLSAWTSERDELKRKILTAPQFRVFHILQDIDRQVNELQLTSEVMANFSAMVRELFANNIKYGSILAILAFLFSDLISKLIIGSPDKILLEGIITGQVDISQLIIPMLSLLIISAGTLAVFSKISFPKLLRRVNNDLNCLARLDTEYQRNLWHKVKPQVSGLLSSAGLGQLFGLHKINHHKIKKFMADDLKTFYESVQKRNDS
jgi:EH domain-containing protein 1